MKLFQQIWEYIQFAYYSAATWMLKRKCERLKRNIKELQDAAEWWEERQRQKH